MCKYALTLQRIQKYKRIYNFCFVLFAMHFKLVHHLLSLSLLQNTRLLRSSFVETESLVKALRYQVVVICQQQPILLPCQQLGSLLGALLTQGRTAVITPYIASMLTDAPGDDHHSFIQFLFPLLRQTWRRSSRRLKIMTIKNEMK